jgi:hypothetical protein
MAHGIPSCQELSVNRRRRLEATVALALLAGLGAACSGSAPRPATGAAANARRAPDGHLTDRLDPYKASRAFAACMRQHGVPHPDPDRAGNFHLTPHDEALMRRVSRRKHEAAEKACFHHLKGVVSTKPLSPRAKARARRALEGLSRCMRAHGYDFFSDPIVGDMSRGRAFFGFKKTDPAIMKAQGTERYRRAQRTCEKALNAKLDRIIADDRRRSPL